MRRDGQDRVFRAPGAAERIDARFAGIGFAPHRHDTYALGVTVEGVQEFDYRGAVRRSLPGQIVVLHPDEVHDGRAGDGAGFRYRAIHVEPALIQEALGGRALPFVDGGVSADPRLACALLPLIEDYGRPLDELEYHDGLSGLAAALSLAAGAGASRPAGDYAAARRVRAFLDEAVDAAVGMDEVECVAGHDRWRVSRDFRCFFGTSPYRYLISRRLERARSMMRAGVSIAEAACACCFADQSHFTRQFKKAYGQTPGAWLASLG